jgi:hypothetical protein
LYARVQAVGVAVHVTVAAGEHFLESTYFNNHTAASELWLIGEPGATIHPMSADQHNILTVAHGALRVHVSEIRFTGQLKVQRGELRLSGCSIETSNSRSAEPDTAGDDLHEPTVVSIEERALSVVGGQALVEESLLRGPSGGAIGVMMARLTVIGCTIRDSRASMGGAMLVYHGANVEVVRSNFTNNSAFRGGGLLVAAGQVNLQNSTLFEQNSAYTGSAVLLTTCAHIHASCPTWTVVVCSQGDCCRAELRSGRL